MEEKLKSQMPAKTEDLTIEKLFNARLERVWEACTNPEVMKQWWGPEEFTAPVIKMDFRVGGKYLYCMRSPDGKEYWSTGVFKKIVPLKKIVYTDSFSDAEGNVVSGTYYGMSEAFPTELMVTFTFEEIGSKTRFTLMAPGLPAGEHYQGACSGWNTSLNKLKKVVEKKERRNIMNKTMFVAEPGSQNVVITHMFDESPEVVYKIMTDPIQIPQWWGPREMTTEVDMFQPREGGVWRFIQHDSEGKRYGFHGVYHEIEPEKRLVYTFEYEGMPGHVMLIIDTLENIEGMTNLTELTVFPSVEERDGMVQANMQMGIEQSFERIDELLKECCGEMV